LWLIGVGWIARTRCKSDGGWPTDIFIFATSLVSIILLVVGLAMTHDTEVTAMLAAATVMSIISVLAIVLFKMTGPDPAYKPVVDLTTQQNASPGTGPRSFRERSQVSRR
jgi:hypothetical protein